MSVTINSITFDGDGHVVFKFSNGLKQRILIPAPETKLTVGWFLDNILAVTLEGSNLIVEYLSGQSVTYTLSDEGTRNLRNAFGVDHYFGFKRLPKWRYRIIVDGKKVGTNFNLIEHSEFIVLILRKVLEHEPRNQETVGRGPSVRGIQTGNQTA